jgi:hypothetical protein
MDLKVRRIASDGDGAPDQVDCGLVGTRLMAMTPRRWRASA